MDYEPKIGDVWRKDGPCDWVKVKSRQWPGYPEYDGGLRGASVVLTNHKGNWCRKRCFMPASTPDAFAVLMKDHCRELVE